MDAWEIWNLFLMLMKILLTRWLRSAISSDIFLNTG